MDANQMIERISKDEFMDMVSKYHYSKVLPKLSKYYLADRQLKAVMSLGWGVRPVHTIKKLFPSLSSGDYYEIGKMCIADEMPKNTATQFISETIKWLKINCPERKILFTWADGMLSKPGYVYQAANFYYGGYILTDTYLTNKGEKVHPRSTGKIGGRPTRQLQTELGWSHWRGKQFRYAYFLCSKKDKKRLLLESKFNWVQNQYPKEKDLLWFVQTPEGWVKADSMPYNKDIAIFSDNAMSVRRKAKQGLLFPVDGSVLHD